MPTSLTEDEFKTRLDEHHQLLQVAIAEDLKQNRYFMKLKAEIPNDIYADLTRVLVDMSAKAVSRVIDLVYQVD